jgi:hypothetical protein
MPPLLVTLLLTACSSGGTTVGTAGSTGGTPDVAAAASSSPTSSTPAGPPTSSPSGSASPAGDQTGAPAVDVQVQVAKGQVDPPVHRVNVPVGAQVRLTVTSDVADAVHVHGYDLEQTLPAGSPATLEFTADQVGLFEVETHHSGLQLVQLVVQ